MIFVLLIPWSSTNMQVFLRNFVKFYYFSLHEIYVGNSILYSRFNYRHRICTSWLSIVRVARKVRWDANLGDSVKETSISGNSTIIENVTSKFHCSKIHFRKDYLFMNELPNWWSSIEHAITKGNFHGLTECGILLQN